MIVQLAHLTLAALDQLRDESERKLPDETGGILVGRFQSGVLDVERIIGPGPNALHTRSGFRRDGAYAQQALNRLYDQSVGALDYVGEWHSHPYPVGPSPRDWRSMRWIAKNPHYAPKYPLLIIVQRTRAQAWKPVAFQWRTNTLVRLPVTIVTSTQDEHV